MAASKMSIRTLFDDYRQWVVKHPDLLSQIESVGRITSYLIAGNVLPCSIQSFPLTPTFAPFQDE